MLEIKDIESKRIFVDQNLVSFSLADLILKLRSFYKLYDEEQREPHKTKLLNICKKLEVRIGELHRRNKILTSCGG